ncbi:hypothetical protein TIFTF001_002551 [Ficus carica]|uniref:Uncharacterized protein n=1 Tax=Ficus carica TaxID=3494 RepID=A0AA87Z4A8_FICCA|nr:hypothetical protein TIFTF001_002551 [Ficus carica]
MILACKIEVSRSKWDTSGMSAKGTPMLKSAFPRDLGSRVTLMGHIPSAFGGWQVLCQFGQVVEASAEVGTMTVGTGQCGRGSMGRPSQRGLSHGRESVTRTSTLEPDRDLLEVPKGELIRGSPEQRR